MNTFIVLLVISVCCSVGYCRSLRTRRFVPYWGFGGDMPDAMQDWLYQYYYMTGTFPSWEIPSLPRQPYYNVNPPQTANRGQPSTGTTRQPTAAPQQQLTTAQRSPFGLQRGQRVIDPIFGSGVVAKGDGGDGKVLTNSGYIVTVDGTDRSYDRAW